ncbi:hypothetical protein Taro_008795 [Colocasia esculenta]|uniref:Uncharacterized protein n=1 Tax=Colocasia esculenta TaxID=4460 RepID=A0A843TZ61_COLES|nr:hypothetical protein [Colocasia esculenta]
MNWSGSISEKMTMKVSLGALVSSRRERQSTVKTSSTLEGTSVDPHVIGAKEKAPPYHSIPSLDRHPTVGNQKKKFECSARLHARRPLDGDPMGYVCVCVSVSSSLAHTCVGLRGEGRQPLCASSSLAHTCAGVGGEGRQPPQVVPGVATSTSAQVPQWYLEKLLPHPPLTPIPTVRKKGPPTVASWWCTIKSYKSSTTAISITH